MTDGGHLISIHSKDEDEFLDSKKDVYIIALLFSFNSRAGCSARKDLDWLLQPLRGV